MNKVISDFLVTQQHLLENNKIEEFCTNISYEYLGNLEELLVMLLSNKIISDEQANNVRALTILVRAYDEEPGPFLVSELETLNHINIDNKYWSYAVRNFDTGSGVKQLWFSNVLCNEDGCGYVICSNEKQLYQVREYLFELREIDIPVNSFRRIV